MLATIKTPCRQICAVDGRSGRCIGCERTLKEIAGWSRMAPEEREAILAALPARTAERAAAAAAPAGG